MKDLARRTASDKILHDKAFDIAKNSKNNGFDSAFPSMVYKFFDRKSSGTDIKNEDISNKGLA